MVNQIELKQCKNEIKQLITCILIYNTYTLIIFTEILYLAKMLSQFDAKIYLIFAENQIYKN